MMVWLGGVMCKLTVAAFLPLQMAENHLNLPTQVQFFTLTSFISSSTSFTTSFSTSFTTAFGGISLWQICATTKGKSPLNSTLTTLHYRYIRGASNPVSPTITPHPAPPQVRWMEVHSLFTFSRERLLTSKYFQDALLHLLPPF